MHTIVHHLPITSLCMSAEKRGYSLAPTHRLAQKHRTSFELAVARLEEVTLQSLGTNMAIAALLRPSASATLVYHWAWPLLRVLAHLIIVVRVQHVVVSVDAVLSMLTMLSQVKQGTRRRFLCLENSNQLTASNLTKPWEPTFRQRLGRRHSVRRSR